MIKLKDLLVELNHDTFTDMLTILQDNDLWKSKDKVTPKDYGIYGIELQKHGYDRTKIKQFIKTIKRHD